MRAVALLLLASCAGASGPTAPAPHPGPMSAAADAQMIEIPAGRYIAGSTPEEREQAYDDYFTASGQETARENHWFDREEDRHPTELPVYRMDLMPVTNAQYAEYVAAGGAPAPSMDEATWKAQGFSQKWPDEVVRFVWVDGRPPAGREDHPVVLVTFAEAEGYCAWRGRRLPTAAEMEKAARGEGGLSYPWGNTFEPDKLNSNAGPRDTVPVGNLPEVKSPFGVLDLAGNVYQWTSTPWPPGADESAAKRTVKGSAWDDWPGLGRGAARHGRARTIRHVIVGFRCAGDAP